VSVAFGPDYAGSAAPLAILAWTLPLLAMSLPYGNILIAADRQWLFMRHNIAGVIANVAGTAAAIPVFGLAGAAYATVLAAALVMALNYRSAVRLGLTESLWAVFSGRSAGEPTVPLPPGGSERP
jgi:O-antigen/teichoic acid export membrane protein